jgi:hypothetical protein
MNTIKHMNRFAVQLVTAVVLALAAFGAWQLEVTLLGWDGLKWLGAWRSQPGIAVCTGGALLLPYLSSSRGALGGTMAAVLIVLVGYVLFRLEASALASVAYPGHLLNSGPVSFSPVVAIWLFGAVALWASLSIGFKTTKWSLPAICIGFPLAFVASIAFGRLIPAWNGSTDPIESLKMGWWALLAPLCAWASSRLATISRRVHQPH